MSILYWADYQHRNMKIGTNCMKYPNVKKVINFLVGQV